MSILDGDPTPAPAGAASEPASAPPATEAPSAEPTPPLDVAAIEARLKEIDPSWGLDNFADEARKQRQALSRLGRELTEVRTEFGRVKPLLDATDQDENLRRKIDDTIRSYYEDALDAGYRPMAPSHLSSAIDPVHRELNAIKTDVVTMRMEAQLDDLAKQGFPLTPDRREAIIQRVLETGWGSPHDHAMALYGQEWTQMKIAEAVRAEREAISKNSTVYRQVSNTGPTVGAAPKPIAQMSDEEWEADAISAIKSMGMRKLPTLGGPQR